VIRVFVNGKGAWFEGLRNRLRQALEHLELSEDALQLEAREPGAEVVSDSSDHAGVVLLFSDGERMPTSREVAMLADYMQDGSSVIPVVDTFEDFDAKVPEPLTKLNGFALGTKDLDYDGLVALVLDRAWNLRRRRRVFISYRRVDSAGVARQLQAALTHRGYEVFLDESSIPHGADFQRELKSWLNDADLLLVLVSPRLGESRWVLEEIQTANTSHVGVLGVCWPELPADIGEWPGALSSLWEDQTLRLEQASFTGARSALNRRLITSALEEVLTRVEVDRPRAMHTRIKNLIPGLQALAVHAGLQLQPSERFGDFRVTDTGRRKTGHLRVLPFRPGLAALHALKGEMSRGNQPDVAACFYFENDPGDPQKTALEWALEPAHRGKPSRYRLLAYDGALPGSKGSIDLGDLL
jgi:hypothetical protein